jgi:hypothetical protein
MGQQASAGTVNIKLVQPKQTLHLASPASNTQRFNADIIFNDEDFDGRKTNAALAFHMGNKGTCKGRRLNQPQGSARRSRIAPVRIPAVKTN